MVVINYITWFASSLLKKLEYYSSGCLSTNWPFNVFKSCFHEMCSKSSKYFLGSLCVKATESARIAWPCWLQLHLPIVYVWQRLPARTILRCLFTTHIEIILWPNSGALTYSNYFSSSTKVNLTKSYKCFYCIGKGQLYF